MAGFTRMEALGINWKILIGQLINFAILFFLLKKFAFKPFLNILERRKTKIEEGIKKSEEAEKSLQKIKGLWEEVKKNAEEKARNILRESEAKAAVIKDGILVSAANEKTRILEEAKLIAKNEITAQKENYRKQMVENTFLLAEKFLKEKSDREKDKKFLEEVIAELKN